MRKITFPALIALTSVMALGFASQPRIIQPHDPPPLPPGPGRTELVNDCSVCHTLRYITMQPHFSRKVWQAEVQKMVTAYKAPINARDQEQIVDYLVANFGTPEGAKSVK